MSCPTSFPIGLVLVMLTCYTLLLLNVHTLISQVLGFHHTHCNPGVVNSETMTVLPFESLSRDNTDTHSCGLGRVVKPDS